MMDRTMCPGQDTRYWRPGDIFTVPCASCGAPVEFFKDDATRRCGRCGARMRNPRLSTGCAQWCAHAQECLGYDPAGASRNNAFAGRSVADVIIDALKNELSGAEDILAGALAAFDRAQALTKGGSSDPGVVIPAVLLLHADTGSGGRTDRAERIMKEAGVGPGAIDAACAIIRAFRTGESIDSPDFRAVAESYRASSVPSS